MEFHVRRMVMKTYISSTLWVALVVQLACGSGVKLDIQPTSVILDNGFVQLAISNPEAMITSITYNGGENLLETLNKEDNRGCWDLYWDHPGGKGKQERLKTSAFNVIIQNQKLVEISFTRTWDTTKKNAVPMNIDTRFIMLDGSHGFYTYSIYEHQKGWPDFNLNGTRLAFKLSKKLFQYMAVDENRQRIMPLPDDRLPKRGQELEYKEAVRLTNPVNPNMTGEVDDKYQYTNRVDEIKVHGWVTTEAGKPPVGFWHITPSHEYRLGGPFKQDLTSHVGPTSLTVFFSAHYMGNDQCAMFRDGEYWKKVLGPVFIYLNSGPVGSDERSLWDDANKQLKVEERSWPYSFPASDDFPKAEERVFVTGRLLVQDRYVNETDIPADSAYVGLALPGEPGSWQTEGKGYQFWTRAGPDGKFTIPNVREGIYDLYATVPGFIGDYKSNKSITVTAGKNIDLGDLVYNPPRTSPTLWEIGYPDRTALEFYIPDPDPAYLNPVLKDEKNKFRNYGLWEKYTTMYPKDDLVYTINSSDYRKDWFYAHITRKVGVEKYAPTTWQIKFNLDNVGKNGTYKLRMALACAARAEIQVRFNDLKAEPPHFNTQVIGQDNAIARHGSHGLYYLYNIDVDSGSLVKGENTIFLTQARRSAPFNGVMYDYIRLEGSNVSDAPSPSPSGSRSESPVGSPSGSTAKSPSNAPSDSTPGSPADPPTSSTTPADSKTNATSDSTTSSDKKSDAVKPIIPQKVVLLFISVTYVYLLL